MNDTNRIEEITQRLVRSEEKNLKRAKRYLQVGICLAVFIAGYLTFLTAKIRQVDAQTLSEFARLEIQQQIPEAAASLRTHLQGQAPDVVGKAFQSALDALPQLRETFAEQIAVAQADAIAEFEQHLVELSTEAIRSSRENLNEIKGEHSDVEKLQMLMDVVGEQIRTAAQDSLDALYPTYAAEIAKMKTFLVRLQEDEGVQLTEKEQVQKAIIESVLQLIARAAQDYGSDRVFGLTFPEAPVFWDEQK